MEKRKKKKKAKVNKGHWLEITDRIFCIEHMIHELLQSHPTTMLDADLRHSLDMAQDHLGDAYQRAGSKL